MFPRPFAFGWFLAVFLVLASTTARAAQDSNSLSFGPITVELKRVNTIAGGNNANLIYGTAIPNDPRLFIVQQGSPSPSSLPGRIRYLDPTTVDGTVGTLLDFSVQLPGSLDTGQSEKGLLGLAFHPDFAEPSRPGYLKLYTYSSEHFAAHGALEYTHPETGTNLVNHLAVLREWTANSVNPTAATPSRVLIRIAEPQNQHNSATIAFHPVDGYLYWAIGDGGGNSTASPDFVGAIDSLTDGHSNSSGPGVPHGNGQDRTTPLGSMMRINPLSAATAPDPATLPSANGQYQIPTNNPFTLQSNIDPQTGEPYPAWNPDWVDEIFAYGLRNPYRFSIDPGANPSDPARGRIYAGDAGYNSRESVDIIVRGGNYGWVIREGSRSMEGVQGIPAYTAPVNAATGLPDTLINPIAEYDASGTSGTGVGRAIIGGFVYRGSRLPALYGKYVFGEYNTRLSTERGILFYLDPDEEKDPTAQFTIYRLGISPNGDSKPALELIGFGQDANGELYALFEGGFIMALHRQAEPHVPLLLHAELLNPGQIRLSFPTHTGRNYRIEFKNVLDETLWNEIQTLPGTGELIHLDVPSAQDSTRFYRVISELP